MGASTDDRIYWHVRRNGNNETTRAIANAAQVIGKAARTLCKGRSIAMSEEAIAANQLAVGQNDARAFNAVGLLRGKTRDIPESRLTTARKGEACFERS